MQLSRTQTNPPAMPGVVKNKAKGSHKEPVEAFSLSADKSSLNPALASLFASSVSHKDAM